jgi:asparagine synthase (glutamine-hydrolysing)
LSGIAGVVMLDGAPVDQALVRRMAGFLAFRGPDAQNAWTGDSAGLAFSLLKTGGPADAVDAPFSLDGAAWIVADARIDGRGELIDALKSAGREVGRDAPDAALVLHAYHAWGDACVERLIGDFAFAVWDGARRRLFCARDHFGVKPFYHARAGGAFVFSNTLDCVRLHPGVSGALDDVAVADFLVFNHPQDLDLTIWRDVRALPPAHTLVVEDGRVRVSRYWRLPLDPEPLRLPRVMDYVERFVDVLGSAVRDRLPENGDAAFFLSGGRDSTTLAALAREAIDREGRRTELRGYSAFYQRLLYDDEPPFTRMAAEALGIPVRFMAVDDYDVFGRWETPELYRPEPTDSSLLAIEADQLRQAAGHARVLFTGQGGDPALRESRSRLTRLAAHGRLLRAAREAAQYAWWHRRLPRPGVRTYLADRSGASRWHARVPEWIAPEFARRVGLQTRVAEWNARTPPAHPLRPEAAESLSGALWPSLFAGYDPGVTRVPIEVRHPYFDVRVIALLLSIPPSQWYNDKGLPRIGMRGRLPEPLLRRPKTPLSGDPLEARLKDRGARWLGGRVVEPAAEAFVDADKVPRNVGGRGEHGGGALWQDIRPLALSLWLSRMHLG